MAFKRGKQKLSTNAKTTFRALPIKLKKRRYIIKRTTPGTKRQREPSKVQFKRKLDLSTSSLDDDLQNKLESAEKYIDELKIKLYERKGKIMKLEMKNLRLLRELEHMNLKNITYKHLKAGHIAFQYLCELSVQQFDLVMKFVQCNLLFIPYSGSKVSEKLFSFETQFLVTLTNSQHGIDLQFMAFILSTLETTA